MLCLIWKLPRLPSSLVVLALALHRQIFKIHGEPCQKGRKCNGLRFAISRCQRGISIQLLPHPRRRNHVNRRPPTLPCSSRVVAVNNATMASEKQAMDASVTQHVQDISVEPKREHSVTGSKGDVESSQDSTALRATDPIIAKEPKRTWRSAIWDSLDKDPKERKLVFKLDCALLTIGCLGYFVSPLVLKSKAQSCCFIPFVLSRMPS